MPDVHEQAWEWWQAEIETLEALVYDMRQAQERGRALGEDRAFRQILGQELQRIGTQIVKGCGN